MTFYADTSALARAYFADEDDHAELRAMLLEGENAVVSSELARLELRRAVFAAVRAGRFSAPDGLLQRVDADCAPPGPVSLVALDPPTILATAANLVERHPLGTLDSIHLAVALDPRLTETVGGSLVFVSRDARQRAAAEAEGLAVA